ncbi:MULTISPECIES: SDR family NAD(P)-dependent oxidoreductase [Trueperella]|uniref:NADP-dependent 3-hydroxy acid dehydrogenase YdfG n=1 Tax=Trueperella abortisuis TaxID=445930 RepID=A0ABT9PHB5_9ACTO|nr:MULTISPECIES: SDR family oxidoreductase [Trueperella]MDP9832098.1 NADP-dependent 3-hydroxy acid dehydrogenase YdfG [Trueperella abortisuis]MDY5404219.1 SDR family oxidoreductase [Trueperella sp.]
MTSALVTGASSGIGAAAVRALTKDGLRVIATARREDRLRALAEETGCEYVAGDLLADGVDAIGAYLAEHGPVDVLVNNAGGALGTDPVGEGNVEEWRRMYELNVLASLKVTQLVLPHMEESGGTLVYITSTAAHDTYPGGAGYTAAKHAERMIPNTLRLELVGKPVRIVEIAPGMVHTEEFSLNRYHGDQAAADRVYAGVEAPLTAEDVAEAIRWCVSLPPHFNVDSMIIRPVAQASNTVVART